jgi:type II secretory pathway pseudopilin PulG
MLNISLDKPSQKKDFGQNSGSEISKNVTGRSFKLLENFKPITQKVMLASVATLTLFSIAIAAYLISNNATSDLNNATSDLNNATSDLNNATSDLLNDNIRTPLNGTNTAPIDKNNNIQSEICQIVNGNKFCGEEEIKKAVNHFTLLNIESLKPKCDESLNFVFNNHFKFAKAFVHKLNSNITNNKWDLILQECNNYKTCNEILSIKNNFNAC